jgi:multimeric flavodoxin WrbA
MNILAIMGSYRKGKTIDTLMDKAIEGAKANNSNIRVDKLYLIDKNIKYCKNCMVCRKDDENKNIADCVISDDMQIIYPMIEKADGFIFGTPVNMGAVTAIMKTFLERTAWVFAKPGKRPIHGCPTPRTTRKKRAIIIVSSGIVPPLFRRWCDDATPLIKSHCVCHFNTKVLGSLYAGAVEKRGIDVYLDKAYKLGKKLTS